MLHASAAAGGSDLGGQEKVIKVIWYNYNKIKIYKYFDMIKPASLKYEGSNSSEVNRSRLDLRAFHLSFL